MEVCTITDICDHYAEQTAAKHFKCNADVVQYAMFGTKELQELKGYNLAGCNEEVEDEDGGQLAQALKCKQRRIPFAANRPAILFEMPRHSNPASDADVNVNKGGDGLAAHSIEKAESARQHHGGVGA